MEDVKKSICIVGLGYVGLPLAVLCSKKGYSVLGYDINKEKVDMIIEGISPVEDVKDLCNVTATADSVVISKAEIVIICVPTPVDKEYHPDLKPLVSAVELVSDNLKKGSLVIIESTINPGVTEEIVKPILEKKYRDGEHYYLAHCPERINPGDKKWNVENLPRILGSTTCKGLELAYDFYNSILTSEIKKMSSVKAAEAVKIVENSFRDVNIAFVNELAKSFGLMGIDVVEVIKGAATKPFAFMPHYPSCGVGGHCIPVDPYYLIEKAKEIGFNHHFLSLARKINNSMPEYTVDLINNAIQNIGNSIEESTIGILGVAYKGGVADIRESPALVIIELLNKKGAKMKIYDPHVKDKSNASVEEVLKCDCVVLLTDHQEFKGLDYSKAKCVVDGKNFLERKKIKNYIGIGR